MKADRAVLALCAALGDVRLVDLTHKLRIGMPVWPTHPPFYRATAESYRLGDVAFHHALFLGEHTGTHIDAPPHFIGAEGESPTIDTIPPERLVGRMRTIDATATAPCGTVQPELVERWEAEHGPIEPDDAVFFHFGWDRFWRSPDTYTNVLKDWPGLSGAASALLVERRVRIVGSDCISIDRFGSSDYPAHRTLLGAGILICENFDRLGELPATCCLAVFPLPIAGGSGSPVRAIAFVPR
jgi:kynurenine formamidase